MKLKAVYGSQEEIPEGYAELFTERNGQWEFSGLEGVKTQADIDRIQSALTKERKDHKETKDKLAVYADIDPEAVHTMSTELESAKAQLEAINKDGRIDEAKLEPIIAARVKQAVGPLERDKANLERRIEKLTGEKAAVEQEVGNLKTSIVLGGIERTVKDAATNDKVLPSALDDIAYRASRVFEQTEDGRVITKDVPGVVPGLSPKEWLADLKEKAPHFWPPSVGGGSGGGGGSPTGKGNPWSKDGWNITAQGAYVKAHGAAKASSLAESVGSKLGATKPPGA
jgi:hypothetical protein